MLRHLSNHGTLRWRPNDAVDTGITCMLCLFYSLRLLCSVVICGTLCVCFQWRGFGRHSGVSIKTILATAHRCQRTTDCAIRRNNMRYLVTHLDSYLAVTRTGGGGCYRCVWSEIVYDSATSQGRPPFCN